MFNSIIQNIAKPFNRRENNQSGEAQSGQPTRTGINDRVDDGFLLVGDTASERTIVNAHNFNTEKVDAPPTYGVVSSNCLPSYHDYTSSMSPTLDVSQFPGIQHGGPFTTGSPTVNTGRQAPVQSQGSPTFTADINPNRTAISDVPFVLGNGIQSHSFIEEMCSINLFKQTTFDYSRYDYNFTLEMLCLNEHECYRGIESMEVTKNCIDGL